MNKVEHWGLRYGSQMKINLSSGDLVFRNGTATLTQAQHKELTRLMESGRPDLTQTIYHMDKEAAEKIALEHMKSARPQAASGATNSQNTEIALKELESRDDVLRNETGGNLKQAQDDLEAAGILITEAAGLPKTEDTEVVPEGAPVLHEDKVAGALAALGKKAE